MILYAIDEGLLTTLSMSNIIQGGIDEGKLDDSDLDGIIDWFRANKRINIVYIGNELRRIEIPDEDYLLLLLKYSEDKSEN